MSTTFIHLNADWNVDPKAPNPKVKWRGDDLRLRFWMHASPSSDYNEGDRGEIIFKDCSRYRLGWLNEEGFDRQQGRFAGVYHRWGEFYEVSGDLRLDAAPEDWNIRTPNVADRSHYLFYFRNNDFECDARGWTMKIIKAGQASAYRRPRLIDGSNLDLTKLEANIASFLGRATELDPSVHCACAGLERVLWTVVGLLPNTHPLPVMMEGLDDLDCDEFKRKGQVVTLRGGIDRFNADYYDMCDMFRIDVALNTAPLLYSYKFLKAETGKQIFYVGKTPDGWIVNYDNAV